MSQSCSSSSRRSRSSSRGGHVRDIERVSARRYRRRELLSSPPRSRSRSPNDKLMEGLAAAAGGASAAGIIEALRKHTETKSNQSSLSRSRSPRSSRGHSWGPQIVQHEHDGPDSERLNRLDGQSIITSKRYRYTYFPSRLSGRDSSPSSIPTARSSSPRPRHKITPAYEDHILTTEINSRSPSPSYTAPKRRRRRSSRYLIEHQPYSGSPMVIDATELTNPLATSSPPIIQQPGEMQEHVNPRERRPQPPTIVVRRTRSRSLTPEKRQSHVSDAIDHLKLKSSSQVKIDSSSSPPSGARGITQYTLEELCEEIRSSPELATYPVDDLYRREIPTGVQHEFIIIRSAPRHGRPATWIRIDRAAMGYRERFRLTSRYVADDTVRISCDISHLWSLKSCFPYGSTLIVLCINRPEWGLRRIID